MDTPTARLITDNGKAPRITLRGGVLSAVRCYQIDTADELRAWGALGLPVYLSEYPGGTAIGAGAGAELVCTGREVFYTHGTDDATTGLGGWCEARLDYEQAAPGGGDLPVIGNAYSEIECITSSVHITNGLDDADVTTGAFANGRGCSKDVGGTILRVSSYITPQTFADLLQRLVGLQTGQKYNLEAIAAPPVRGSQATMEIPAGWAQYVGYKVEYVGAAGGMLRLTHTLKVVEDGWAVRWRKIDELATPVGPILTTPIYERADFTGLW